MKTAVIFESSPFDRKGLFNAVHNRLLHLRMSSQVQTDVYCVHSRDNALTRAVRHTPVAPDVESVDIDGIEYKMLWYRFSITDHLILEKLHHHPPQFLNFLKKKVRMFKDYDLVIAHSFTGALFAYAAYLKYGVPYFVTWHGSDIHTHPRRNPIILEDLRVLMKSAECNFFVSKALLAESERIVTGVPKDVLYNGVSDGFVRFSAERRSALRTEWGIAEGEKVVAFVGNLSPVKNVLALPEIFKAVADRYDGPVQFLVAGDGKLRRKLEDAVSRLGISVSFLGNVPADKMPEVMNCIDVLVLPSLNEGLPLVCAEALRCGANVVGSASGGIPEVIGQKNTFLLGDRFVDEISERIVTMLSTTVSQTIPSEMSWTATAAKELAAISQL
ncbi:MAG: glycosyltransferase [Bacteroidales bacterium]|nr:glycosyltransferase [Bacteroidales bacterium]